MTNSILFISSNNQCHPYALPNSSLGIKQRHHWAYQPPTELFESIAGNASSGCVISFETTGISKLSTTTYALKSPSFGTEFLFAAPSCLAHYT